MSCYLQRSNSLSHPDPQNQWEQCDQHISYQEIRLLFLLIVSRRLNERRGTDFMIIFFYIIKCIVLSTYALRSLGYSRDLHTCNTHKTILQITICIVSKYTICGLSVKIYLIFFHDLIRGMIKHLLLTLHITFCLSFL
jgi:hypothetical protein